MYDPDQQDFDKGRASAECFTWGPVAEKTWEVYAEVTRKP
jgi:hypothetical protein